MSATPSPPNIFPLRPRDHDDAARAAVTWLAERHRKGWRKAFEDLLDDWQPEGSEGSEGSEGDLQLDDDGITMVSVNAGEWLIVRGQIHARGGLRDINSYLLGSDGPYLTPGQKAWITQLRERPLRLYRVTDVRPGEGLTLVDELDAQAEPQSVREISGSRSTRPGMLLGARIMHLGGGADGHRELSGATYPFAKLHETQVLAQVRQALAGAAALKLHAENLRHLVETVIARAWLAQWFEPAPLPQICDAATGDAEQGWPRETRSGDGQVRSLARAHANDDAETPEPTAVPAPAIPPEVLTRALEQFIHRHYAHWCDETIPALGGRTPRQAITTPAGLERVKELLREYEDSEGLQCAAQKRPAVSYQFLWDALGISRYVVSDAAATRHLR